MRKEQDEQKLERGFKDFECTVFGCKKVNSIDLKKNNEQLTISIENELVEYSNVSNQNLNHQWSWITKINAII